MRYGTVCSGIEAPTAAWHPLGWEPVFFSEIEAFPNAVLKHHYPHVPNLGDMTRWKDWPDYDVELICGGTPCQSFSVAGLRKGMDDPRGNLALIYLAVIDRYRPRWVLWENVPGVLSSGGGRDFGSFLGGLAQLGYGWAYRVLDAQFFGVPQRRRRVFVVGHIGDWRPAAAVLFERESLRGNPPPGRKEGEGVARSLTGSTGGCSAKEQQHTFISGENEPLNQLTVMAHGQGNAEIQRDGEPFLTCNHEAPIVIQDARGMDKAQNGLGIGEDVAYTLDQTGSQAVCFHASQDPDISGDVSHPIGAQHNGMSNAVALRIGGDYSDPTISVDDKVFLAANPMSDRQMTIINNMTVRRLTPRECERLQGFPDDYTLIPYRGKPAEQCPDGPRYKALGNSMAVPVVRWIGERIQAWEAMRP